MRMAITKGLGGAIINPLDKKMMANIISNLQHLDSAEKKDIIIYGDTYQVGINRRFAKRSEKNPHARPPTIDSFQKSSTFMNLSKISNLYHLVLLNHL